MVRLCLIKQNKTEEEDGEEEENKNKNKEWGEEIPRRSNKAQAIRKQWGTMKFVLLRSDEMSPQFRVGGRDKFKELGIN